MNADWMHGALTRLFIPRRRREMRGRRVRRVPAELCASGVYGMIKRIGGGKGGRQGMCCGKRMIVIDFWIEAVLGEPK